jgi:hypothetical protein
MTNKCRWKQNTPFDVPYTVPESITVFVTVEKIRYNAYTSKLHVFLFVNFPPLVQIIRCTLYNE